MVAEESDRLRDYRIEQCENRLNTGAASFGRLRAMALAALLSGIGGLVSGAYSLGARSARVEGVEATVGELVKWRQEQEKERAELVRRQDALTSQVEAESAMRVSLEELVRAALIAKPRSAK